MAEALMSPLLARVAGVRHGFFTRRGGVSAAPYASLNVGLGSQDDPARVRENRGLAAATLGVDAVRLVTAYQVHSPRAVHADGPWPGPPPEADALASATPGLALGILTADCAPILLADPEAGVVGAAHAGWRGALDGVVEAVVAAMEAKGARRSRVTAAVGPCIAQGSYEVGLEFEARFLSAAPEHGAFFGPGSERDKRQFDLPGFVLHRLAQAGVAEAEWVGHDTCAQEALFFSHRRGVRRGEPDYGRLLSAIVLADS